METSQEILKAKIFQAKIDLENKGYEYVSNGVIINLKYSCLLNQISYKGEILDTELTNQINFAINEVKKRMSDEYTAILQGMGIKF
ncbi:hypothetical protein [Flavobacterium psychrophilum]|uniref:hypothetical protein n=1 Tax=Flavobacterium psychrophilum TaxID=96345 RepID=UPI0004E7F5D0|nr:hypothetical protein [Flavobacterium psychrophilum]AIJ36950.1 hypothetical protein FPSM_00455 [Flavobacterium psychrophilum]AIN72740.1 hypothetical protein FPG101_02285 [Flavobacterium psychrophilum FPG101]EKT3974254.1 hypothetical protein [Flavobacterium psychrophilum]EKT4526326.1 hypothetical protein [Flavobacterium psychrophilum]EKT4534613.1 hypothetical protein [Flavobacterium psychrophilum]